jgi:hypothetical protein
MDTSLSPTSSVFYHQLRARGKLEVSYRRRNKVNMGKKAREGPCFRKIRLKRRIFSFLGS